MAVEVALGIEVKQCGVYGAADDEHLVNGESGFGSTLDGGAAGIHDERPHSLAGTAQQLEGDDTILAATDGNKI